MHVLAFRRAHHEGSVIVVVPRLTCGLEGKLPIREAWEDTAIRLPADDTVTRWRCELGGQVVQSRDGTLPMAAVTSLLPIAVLSAQR